MDKLHKVISLSFLLLVILLTKCVSPPESQFSVEQKYQAYCGSCHLPPDPANIPKAIWEDNILPEMAARLGYKYNHYNPLAKNSMEENLYIRMTNTYPKQPTIDSATWQQIHDYVITLAPDSISIDTSRNGRNSILTHFKSKPVSLDNYGAARITSIRFEPESSQFVIGDAYGAVHNWPIQDTTLRFDSPLISYRKIGEDEYFTEIGYMNPSEIPLGLIYRKRSGVIDTLAKKLHRPVYTEIVDLNKDGQDEILISEFGNLTGELSMLIQSDTQYEKRTLLPVPGTIKLEIKDMNNDGKDDIIVLASQGNEGIYILYQKEDLKFSPSHVIRMGPDYGSSWFQLFDYDNDGDMDIVLANGDNADYSIFSKPYHGVRLFLNDGANKFEQVWFYPIYGATRILADDYDLDGDIDFAVMSFFPDFDHVPAEGFVYLENKTPQSFDFSAFTFEQSVLGRWLIMEDGDFDQDGDQDIMLGSFQFSAGKGQSEVDGWTQSQVDAILLENQAR